MASESSPLANIQGFLHAFAVQRRVIAALLLREVLTRYGRNNLGFLWLFIEPMLFTLAITLLWTATRSVHGSNLPIVAFALTGYSSMLLWRNMPSRCIGALGANRPLFFHRQVKVVDAYAARLMLELFAATTSFLALGIAFWSFDWLELPEDAMQVLAGWVLLGWFGSSLALTLASLNERFEIIEKMWPPFSYIIFPLSGAAFIADALPEKMREIILYIPVIHGVEFLREGYFGSAFVAHYDLPYLLIWNAALTLFGLSQMRNIGVDRGDE